METVIERIEDYAEVMRAHIVNYVWTVEIWDKYGGIYLNLTRVDEVPEGIFPRGKEKGLRFFALFPTEIR